MTHATCTRRSFLIASGAGIAGAAVAAVAGPANGASAFERTATRASVSGTTADATAELTAYLAGAGANARISGDYYIDSVVVVPSSVRQLELAAGTKIRVRGNHVGLSRAGSITYREKLASAIMVGATSIVVPKAYKYNVGEYLLLSGADVVPGSPDKYGYMRQVTSISGTTVGFDGPIPRTIQLTPRTSAIALSPPLSIMGSGEIFSTSPTAGKSSLIAFFATDTPSVQGIDVHDNGATGINVSYCRGGLIDCTIHDLLDDGTTYFGYGVNVTGATRGLVVAGTMTRVRHAVTTNPGGSMVSIGPAGEPEDCVFKPRAVDCSDKSIDTHRLGWNTTITPTVQGGRGGVQIRADNTHVVGGTIVASAGPGVAIDNVVGVAATVRDVSISYLQPSGNALLFNAPGTATNVTIRDCYNTNIVLSDNCRITGGSISAGNSVGVSFMGSNNLVEGLQLGSSVTTPYIAASGTTGNSFSTSPPDDIDPLPAPVATTPPSITGVLAVGNELIAKFGQWNVGPVTYTYTWTRDGAAISSAIDKDNPKYDLVSADAGKKMVVTVTAHRAGYTNGVASSAASVPVQPGTALTPTTAPVMSGTGKIGTYMSVSQGTWNPYATSITVAWKVNGTTVSTASRYQVKSADAGKQVSVTVAAHRVGWNDGSFTTAPVIAKA